MTLTKETKVYISVDNIDSRFFKNDKFEYPGVRILVTALHDGKIHYIKAGIGGGRNTYIKATLPKG